MKYLATSVLVFLLVTACKKDSASSTNNSTTSPTPVTSIGVNYAGGIVFYLSEDGQHGMVMSPVLDTVKWSLNNDEIDVTWHFGSGAANTNAIVASQGNGVYAAKICQDLMLNGYSDWYLPSSDEFKEIDRFWLSGPQGFEELHGVHWTSSGSSLNDYASAGTLTSNVSICIHEIQRDSYVQVRAVRSF